MASRSKKPQSPTQKRKRRLRAALAADVANFSGRVSVSETHAFSHLSTVLRIGREELARHEGALIGMPGDGLFALFESAVDAVQCALAIQQRLSEQTNLGGMRLRIGLHVGDVLFEDGIPFGETLNIAARLESLADPGGILMSGTMVDAVSARISATFEDRGVPRLKNIPRRITTYAVHSVASSPDEETGDEEIAPLDKTMQFPRGAADSSSANPPVPKPEATVEAEPKHVEPRSEPTPVQAPPLPSEKDPASSPAPPPVPQAGSDSPQAPAAPEREEIASREPSLPPPAPLPQPPPLRPGHKPITQDAIDQITTALAVHLGPVARVMVSRKAKTASSTSELIETLAGELSGSDERIAFRSRLLRYIGR
jgi:class 3 adenylate cyclase